MRTGSGTADDDLMLSPRGADASGFDRLPIAAIGQLG
jgi:hypothetical protein